MTSKRSGWITTTLSEVARWGSGGTPKARDARYYDGDIPWAVIGDLSDSVVTSTSGYITQAGLDESSAKRVPEGAVLVAMYGSIGKLGITGIELTTNQAIAHAVPHADIIDKKFLFYYLMSQRPGLIRAGKGATQSNIGQGTLKQWPIAFPSAISEQLAIVEELEDQLSRLDAAGHSLRDARRRLANWSGGSIDEVFIDEAGRFDWPVVPLEDLRSSEPRSITDGPFGSLLASAHYTQSGARVVRLQNIGDGVFKENDAFVSLEHFETLRNHNVREGDVVIASLGDRIPRAAVVPDLGGPAIVKADCIRVRTGVPEDAEWIALACRSSLAKRWAESRLHGVGRQRLGLGGIRQIPIPRPDSAEDRASAVARLKRALDGSLALEAALDRAEQRGRGLRSGLLDAAFKLSQVEQDEEPILEMADV